MHLSNVPLIRFNKFKDNWLNKNLGKYFRNLSTGMTPSRNRKDYFNGNYLWVTSGELNNGKIKKTKECITGEAIANTNLKLYPPGTFFIAITGLEAPGTRGKCGINEVITTSNQSCLAFEQTKKISNRFLFYWYSKFSERLYRKFAQGTKQQSFNNKIVEKFSFIHPRKEEQIKIASFLTAVDSKIEKLTRKKELLEEYKKGVMQKLFSGEIRFKDENGNDYPDWEEKKIKDISEFRRGSFPQPYGLKKWYDEVNGEPFVQVYDVAKNMKLKPRTKNKISSLAQPLSVFTEKGTILITIQGSIGRIALTQYDAYVDRTLLIFTKFNFSLNKSFFIYVLFQLFDIEKRKAPGGTIKTITKEVLSNFTVRMPILEEQEKIGKYISLFDEKINLIKMKIDKTKEFKKGLLQQMFV